MNESTLYVKFFENYNLIILSLYVDDLLMINNNSRLIDAFKK